MAKKQSFGDKVKKQRDAGRQMVKIVAAEKKANGQYRFKAKMVRQEDVQAQLAAALAAI